MQNFSHLVAGEHFQIGGWMDRVRSSMENWPYLENGERYCQACNSL